jgi:hypothetical protein
MKRDMDIEELRTIILKIRILEDKETPLLRDTATIHLIINQIGIESFPISLKINFMKLIL